MSMSLEQQLSGLNPLQRRMSLKALRGDPLARLWLAPEKADERLDGWQRTAASTMLTKQHDVIMCCCRGSGKTQVFALTAYLEACTVGGFAMILSRSDRQALRIVARAKLYAMQLRLQPVIRENMHELEFANGGRLLALPCSGDTIIGEHGVTLMGIDEAARIKDEFYAVVSPMLAVSEAVTGIKPRKALLSTPFGRSGFFWDEWHRGEVGETTTFKRFRSTWQSCPRIKPEFVEQERREKGDWWVQQEYECQFLAIENCFFDMDAMAGAVQEGPAGPNKRYDWGE